MNRLSVVARDAAMNAIRVLADGGFLRLYGGEIPNSPEAKAKVLPLCELRFDSPAFNAAEGGTITSNPLTPDPSARATGVATWYRAFGADETTVVFDGDVTKRKKGGSMELDETAIQQGAEVAIRTVTITLPASAGA